MVKQTIKKVFNSVLLIILVAVSLCLFGCSTDSGFSQIDNNSSQEFTYNKRYIRSDLVNESPDKQVYVLFKNNGTGEYVRYDTTRDFDTNTDVIVHYKVSFICKVIEDTVICLYDSVTYFEDNVNSFTSYNPKSDWTLTLGFSKDILIKTTGVLYINENYLPKIPNFDK